MPEELPFLSMSVQEFDAIGVVAEYQFGGEFVTVAQLRSIREWLDGGLKSPNLPSMADPYTGQSIEHQIVQLELLQE